MNCKLRQLARGFFNWTLSSVIVQFYDRLTYDSFVGRMTNKKKKEHKRRKKLFSHFYHAIMTYICNTLQNDKNQKVPRMLLAPEYVFVRANFKYSNLYQYVRVRRKLLVLIRYFIYDHHLDTLRNGPNHHRVSVCVCVCMCFHRFLDKPLISVARIMCYERFIYRYDFISRWCYQCDLSNWTKWRNVFHAPSTKQETQMLALSVPVRDGHYFFFFFYTKKEMGRT